MFSLNCKNVNINNMGISELPDLSNEHIIIHITCFNNQLTSIPTLPPNLITLSCNNNQLTSLPPLPPTLQSLTCYNNHLTYLPPLPKGLSNLDCSYNKLSSLPSLPEGLVALKCSNNNLNSLPPLPISLQELFCSNNKITSLPPTINGRLIKISCINNPLIMIPTFADHLKQPIVICSKKNDCLKTTNNKNMRIINNFKHLYYSLKFKRHFYKLLKKSRERKTNKTNKTNRIIISILLIILVIVVIKIIIMMSKIMFGKHELSNNQLPYSRTDSYELIKDKQIKQICITPSQNEPIQYIF